MFQHLFPEYLNKGSHGQAVAVLQLLLVTHRLVDDLLIDGEYGPLTAEAVRRIQEKYGLEQDGHFGPDTRSAFTKEIGFHVNSIPKTPFDRQTYAVLPDKTRSDSATTDPS